MTEQSARSGEPRGDGHTCTTDPQQPCGACGAEYEQIKDALLGGAAAGSMHESCTHGYPAGRQCPHCPPAPAGSDASPTTETENAMNTTALRPHAGFQVTVTRPDGVSYPAHLCRMDGPQGGIAVLYVEPADCPADMEPYTQEVYVKELAEGASVSVLSYTAEQAGHVRAWAQKVLNDAT